MPLKLDKPIHYVSISDLYNINHAVTGGDTFVRDIHLLESAVNRPKTILFGQEQFPTVLEKAAALLHSLAYHHLFADGNKRTAHIALIYFIEENHCHLTWDDDTAYQFILHVAQGELTVEAVADALRPYVVCEE